MNCPIEPLFDRVILREDSPEEVSEGGIHIPDIARDKTKTARVVAIGPLVQSVSVGNRVIHTKYSGTEIELDRVIYTIVAEIELQGRFLSPVREGKPGA